MSLATFIDVRRSDILDSESRADALEEKTLSPLRLCGEFFSVAAPPRCVLSSGKRSLLRFARRLVLSTAHKTGMGRAGGSGSVECGFSR